MARGFLSGLIWGTVVSAGGAVFVSLSNPLPQPPNVASSEPQVAAPTPPAEVVESPQAAQGQDSAGTIQPSSPAAPETDTLTALEEADTTPAEQPSVGTAEPLATASEPDAEAPSVSTTAEAPPAPSVDSTAPQPPAVSEELTISTEPAQPTPPPAIEEDSGFTSPNVAEETPASPASESSETAAAPMPEVAETETEPATEAAETPAEPATTPRVASLPTVGNDETAEPEQETGQASEEIAAAPAQPNPTAPSPGIGQRAGSLIDRDQAASTLPAVTPQDSADTVADPDAPPFERFAAPFENPDDKPLMSIILIDDEASIGAEALQTFPYPLTFAINPFDPNAAQKMARYREAGFEVLALIDLPLEASAQDAETALEAGLATLNEAVGVLEGVGTGVQGSRPLSDQVTAILRDKGYGFVTQNSGLNTVQKLAAREGVPSAFVFRDFDGANQTPTVMRRFLDQAAFRAGQEGGVIMLGRVRPDTVSALLLWGLQDRANRVALAPASSVISAQPPEQ